MNKTQHKKPNFVIVLQKEFYSESIVSYFKRNQRQDNLLCRSQEEIQTNSTRFVSYVSTHRQKNREVVFFFQFVTK